METESTNSTNINSQQLPEILFQFHSILEKQSQEIESLKLGMSERDVTIKKVC